MWRRCGFFVTFCVAFCCSVELPSFLHVCRRNDPKLSPCLTSSIEGLRSFLATGVPEYNISSIEPLKLANFSFRTIGVNFTSDDADLFALSKFYVNKLRADVTNQRFQLDLDVSNLKIVANYTLRGRFLVLPIDESGVMVTDLADCAIKSHFKGDLVSVDDQKHMKLTDCSSKVKCRSGRTDFGDFFLGKESLVNTVLHGALNEDFQNFFEHIAAPLENNICDAILRTGNNIFDMFTYKQLFP